jgi:hypothetical protein
MLSTSLQQGRCGGQGAGDNELLSSFDEMRVVHEAIPADAFNDDADYKTWINQVLGGGLA